MVEGHPVIISEVSLRFHKNTVFCQKKGTLSERTPHKMLPFCRFGGHPVAWGPRTAHSGSGGLIEATAFNVTRTAFDYRDTALHLTVLHLCITK